MLEHMFQMTTLALQAHLEPTSKVVNHLDTLFLPDSPNLLDDGHFQFSNGLRTILIDVVLQEPPEIKNQKGSDQVNAETTRAPVSY